MTKRYTGISSVTKIAIFIGSLILAFGMANPVFILFGLFLIWILDH